MNKQYQYKVYQPSVQSLINRIWQGDFEGDWRSGDSSYIGQYWSALGTPTQMDRYRKDAYNGFAGGTAASLDGFSSYIAMKAYSGYSSQPMAYSPSYVLAQVSANANNWQDGMIRDIIGGYYKNGSNWFGYGITVNGGTNGFISAVVGQGTASLVEAKWAIANMTAGEHKIGMRADGTNLLLFVDNVQVASTAYTGAISWASGGAFTPICFGSNVASYPNATPTKNFFYGVLDQITVYSASAAVNLPSNSYITNYFNNNSLQYTSTDNVFFLDFEDIAAGSTSTLDPFNVITCVLNNVIPVTSVNGKNTCMKIVTSMTGSATQGIGLTSNKPSITGGSTYTASAYVKGPAGEVVNLVITPVGGGSAATQSVTLTGLWQRVSLTYATNAAATNLEIDLVMTNAAASVKTFYIDGVMLEDGTVVDDYFNGTFNNTNTKTYSINTTGRYHTVQINSWSYMTTWVNDVMSEFGYAQEINTAGGQVIVKLARTADNYGERTDIYFNNRVDVYVISDNYPNGQIIFTGKISDYKPVYGDQETIEVTLLGNGDELNQMLIEAGPSIAYNNPDGTGGSYTRGNLSGQYVGQAYTVPANQLNISAVTLSLAPGRYFSGGVWNYVGNSTMVVCIWDNYTSASAFSPNQSSGMPLARQYFVGPPPSPNDAAYGFNPMTVTFTDTAGKPKPVRVAPGQRYYITVETLDYGGSVTGFFSIATSAYNPLAANNDFTFVTANGGAVTTNTTTALTMSISQNYGGTKIAYNSSDPSNILKAIIDDYNRQGGILTYDSNSIRLTGTVVSYTFNTNTTLEGLQQCLTMAPSGWYFYIDQAQNKVYFLPDGAANMNTLTLGIDFANLELYKRAENIVNVVYFTGGPDPNAPSQNIFKRYVNQASVNLYGKHIQKYTDNRVTDKVTMDIIANTILTDHASPEVQTTLELAGGLYNIESIKPGDYIQLRGMTNNGTSSLWDVATFDQSYWDFDIATPETMALKIARYDYSPDTLKTVLSTTPPDVNKRVEDIRRNLEATQAANNPVQAAF